MGCCADALVARIAFYDLFYNDLTVEESGCGYAFDLYDDMLAREETDD